MMLEDFQLRSQFCSWLAGECVVVSRKRNRLAVAQTLRLKAGGASGSALEHASRSFRSVMFLIILFLVQSHLALLTSVRYQSFLTPPHSNSRMRWLLISILGCSGWTISPSTTPGPRCGATTSRIRIACGQQWATSGCRLCVICLGVALPAVKPFQPCLTS